MVESDDIKIPNSFFRTVDEINSQMEKIKEKAGGFEFALADRISHLENKIRHPASPEKLEFDPTEKKIMTPIKKKPFIMTDYERGLGWAGSDMATEGMRRH